MAHTSKPKREPVPHRLIPETGVVIIEPRRRLRPEDFDTIARTVDPWIEEHGALHGIVVSAPKFPGWGSARALIRHLLFVRDHHRDVERVAVAVDGKVAEWTPKIAGPFLEPELKHFDYAHFAEALAWVSGTLEPSAPPAAT